MAYSKLTVPVGPLTDGTDDEPTVGTVGDRATAAILDSDHNVPARSRDASATEGADIQVSHVMNALDYFKLDREKPIWGTVELTGATATYTAGTYDCVIRVDRSVSVTISLPTAVGIEGRMYIFQNVMSGDNVTIDPDGTETVDGESTIIMLAGLNKFLVLLSDGANWLIIGKDSTVPLGAIIAVAGTFTAANNGGSFSQAIVVVGDGWKKCDGTEIGSSGLFVPKMDDGRFLRGHSTPGTPAGSQTVNPRTSFAADGDYTPLGSANSHTHGMKSHSHSMQGHTHTMKNHTHAPGSLAAAIQLDGGQFKIRQISGLSYNSVWRYATGRIGTADFETEGAQILGISAVPSDNTTAAPSTSSTGAPSDNVTDAPSTTGFTGTARAQNLWFLDSAVNIEPKYLTCDYYIRIR